ncbi:MAG: HNH endonuclease [Rubrivivax sp.]|nr:HNH endonuclease [Pyrinomonadaceae bacterium]
MNRRRSKRLTEEQRIRQEFMRRRRRADYNARRRAAKFTQELIDVDRMEILEREGRVCYLCGEFLSVHEMTLDHVVPLARGGAHTPENLRPAHRSCNSRKGKRLLSEIAFSKKEEA